MKKIFSIILALSLLSGLFIFTGCNGDDDDDDNNTPSRTLVNEGILGIFSTGSSDVRLHYIDAESFAINELNSEETRSTAFNYDHSEVCYANYNELLTGDPLTGEFTMITDGNSDREKRYPAYLRDGRIVFANKQGYDNSIQVFDPDDNSVIDTLIIIDGNAQAEILKTSPSGEYIAYMRTDRSYVYCLNLETLERSTPLFDEAESYNWGTLNDIMVQWSDFHLYLVDVPADSTIEILSTTGSDEINGAVLSPDESQIVYFVKQSRTSSQLYIVNADGSGEPELLHDTSEDGASIRNIAISPDGEKVVFYSSPFTSGELKIIDITSKEVQTILDYCSNVNILLWN